MITSIERKVSIKKDNRVIHDKVSLASKYGYISNNIIKTIDNEVIDTINNKVILRGRDVILDNENKITR